MRASQNSTPVNVNKQTNKKNTFMVFFQGMNGAKKMEKKENYQLALDKTCRLVVYMTRNKWTSFCKLEVIM